MCGHAAPRGQTPLLHESFGWKSLSIIGGITLRRFHFQIHKGSIKSPQVIEFIKHLRRHLKGRLLNGWDTHANNREGQATQVKILDPAFAALIRELKKRGLLGHTVVLCGGEFGRSPKINLVEGRDHWPHGFSMMVAGGGFAGGRVIGETDPNGEKENPSQPVRVEDLHATVQSLLGIDFSKEIMTPVGRPIALSDGRVLSEVLA